MKESSERAARQARGFDRLAPFYDLLADVASAGRIHASQRALLPFLPARQRVLVLGGGSGRFLMEMVQGGLVSSAVSIDLSPEMTRRTAARLTEAHLTDKVELRVGSLERLNSNEQFDVIVTHCFLDLFGDAELRIVVRTLNGALRPGGLWLFSDFSVDGPGAAPAVRGTIVRGLYAFFRTTCGISARRLPDFTAAFAHAGLETVEERRFAVGLLNVRLLRKNVH